MADRIHVLTLTDVLVGGGAEALAVEVMLSLDAGRYERTLCVTRWPAVNLGDAAVQRTLAQLEASEVRVLPLRRKGKASLRPWGNLLRFLVSHRVDVVHAHKFGSNIWGVVIGRLARRPVVVSHEHTWSFEGQPIRRFLDRHLIARFSDAFLAVSDEDRRRMIANEGIPPDQVQVVPNGIRARPPTGGRDLRAELGVGPDAPIIVSVGMLRPQKAYDVLLRATAEVRAAHPDVRVLIAGGAQPSFPEEAPRLEAMAAELGLSDVVAFLGRRPDVPDILAAADIAVVSSDFEGSPLSVMEYMAAGLPVVATSVGGIPDLIRDGVDGALVPARDPSALATAMGALLSDPGRARRMGQSARERQEREFDLDRTVRRLESLYAELLAARRGA